MEKLLNRTKRNSFITIKENKKKSLEQAHDALYKNVQLLMQMYPPKTEFKTIFNKTMFLRLNNHSAFQQVIYYLIKILSDDVKLHITNWPIFDKAAESRFRKEVLKYINNLNNLYEDANIPNIQLFTIMSPSGYKFVLCMLQISILVLREVSKKMCPISLESIASKDNLKSLKKLTLSQKMHASNLHKELSRIELERNQEIENITKIQKLVETNIHKLEEKLLLKDNKYEEPEEELNLDQVFDGLVVKVERIERIFDKLRIIKSLTSNLADDCNIIKFDSTDLQHIENLKDLYKHYTLHVEKNKHLINEFNNGEIKKKTNLILTYDIKWSEIVDSIKKQEEVVIKIEKLLNQMPQKDTFNLFT